MNCVAICITQQAHRCSGELQVPSVRPSVVHARGLRGRRGPAHRGRARTRGEEEAGRLESRRTGARRHPRTRAGYDRAAFSLNLLACPSRLGISVFHFFCAAQDFLPEKNSGAGALSSANPDAATHNNTNAATTKTPMPARENPIACTPDVAAAQCLHT